MRRLLGVCLLFSGLCWLPAGAYAANCSGLPTHFTGGEFPSGNFFTNFDNECYLIPFSVGNGTSGEKGDKNSVYAKMYFCAVSGNPLCNKTNLPPYQLIIVGEFHNSRYFSLELYDDHSAVTRSLKDTDIVPLTSKGTNPYLPGVPYQSGLRYAVPIDLGGQPGTLEKGCRMDGFNVDVNALDGTQRHPYINWNLDKPFLQQQQMRTHVVDTPEHSNPNTAGILMIRNYLDLTPMSPANQPHVIVRDVASGCAYPAAYVMNTLSVVMTDPKVIGSWQDQLQINEHDVYANWQPDGCWGTNPSSQLQWHRGNEYTPGGNPDASYLYTYVPAGLTQTLFSAGRVMRVRFRLPTTPPTPCTNGCSRSGNEQTRYVSLSFQASDGVTLASLPDGCPANPLHPCTPLVQDANGYVTLVAGMGEPQPSWVTAANGYTWLDLSQVANYTELNQLAIRDILPAGSFQCGANYVPYKIGEATNTADGSGLMGLYAPVIDYPVATALPTQATPVSGPSSCAVYPAGPPATNHGCAVEPAPPISITNMTTQCDAPGCNQVVAQPLPPISLQGTGFGSFPLGLPFSGTSNFLRLTNTTRNWSAGYTGNQCTVSIGEWTGNLISILVNTGSKSACQLQAGDQLDVTVWNPQTQASTSYTTIAAAPAGAQ